MSTNVTGTMAQALRHVVEKEKVGVWTGPDDHEGRNRVATFKTWYALVSRGLLEWGWLGTPEASSRLLRSTKAGREYVAAHFPPPPPPPPPEKWCVEGTDCTGPTVTGAAEAWCALEHPECTFAVVDLMVRSQAGVVETVRVRRVFVVVQ